MVKRIVKMTFREACVGDFLVLFEKYKAQIRHAEGCLSLELLQAHEPGNVFFTYSFWDDPGYLEQYRRSEVFAVVWPQTKSYFALPAEAWTVNVLHHL